MKIGSILTEFKAKPPISDTPEVLTLTERNGFVRQSDRFNKRLATEDVSNYKFIERDEFAFNPYLLWAGALARNDRFDAGVISPLYPTFRVNPGFDPAYVIRILLAESCIKLYDGIAFGSVPRRRRSSVKDFLALDIPPLPPLDEQRRIADILDKTDTLRAKRREAIAHLDALGESVFMECLRSDSWPMKEFRSLCSRITVGVVVKPASHYVTTGIPVLRSLNVRPGGLVLEQLVHFTEEAHNGSLVKSQVHADDIVTVRTGNAGVSAVVPANFGPLNAVDLIISSPLPEVLSSEFAARFLNSDAGRHQVLGEQRGQIQQHFNVKSLQTMMFPVPPMDVQMNLSDKLDALQKVRAKNVAQLSELDALFLSLQNRAFRGEL